MSTSRRSRRLLPLFVVSLVLSWGATGCKNVVEMSNRGTDDAFIRAPGETPKNTVELRNGALFPMSQGDRWQLLVQSGDKASLEDITVQGPTLVGKEAGIVLGIRHDNKLDRTEVYRSDAEGLFLVSSGPVNDRMVMSPPIPIIRKPIKEGEPVVWNGFLRFRKSQAPGSALSRVSGRETVKTPAGTFGAYRVDTIITTTVKGQQVAFPTTRWIAPGVGLVKQRLLAGQMPVVKELKSYQTGNGSVTP